MADELNNLIRKAETVRDAVFEGENTAERVGGLFVEILEDLAGRLFGDTGIVTMFATHKVLADKLAANGLLTPELKIEHKATSVKLTVPSVGPDGAPGESSASIGAVGIKAGLMLPSHAAAIEQLGNWAAALPVADFAGTVSGVSVTAGGLGRVPSLAAHNAGAASVVFDTGGNRFLLRVGAPISDPPAYYSEWAAAGTGTGALRPYSDYSAGKLFRDTTAGKLYTWDGSGTLRLLGNLSDILEAVTSNTTEIGLLQSRANRHEERLGDLVYKTGKLRTDTDANASAITGNTDAIAALAARVDYLEEYGGGGGPDPSACGCRPLTAADIDSVFDGEAAEPEVPANAEPVTAAQIDDLLDDGVAQTPVESPPGEDRLAEDEIDTLINGIFG